MPWANLLLSSLKRTDQILAKCFSGVDAHFDLLSTTNTQVLSSSSGRLKSLLTTPNLSQSGCCLPGTRPWFFPLSILPLCPVEPSRPLRENLFPHWSWLFWASRGKIMVLVPWLTLEGRRHWALLTRLQVILRNISSSSLFPLSRIPGGSIDLILASFI